VEKDVMAYKDVINHVPTKAKRNIVIKVIPVATGMTVRKREKLSREGRSIERPSKFNEPPIVPL
jgi:hypothetical protein